MTRIADQYAAALYSLAAEENIAETILQELKTVDAVLKENPDYLRLLAASNIPKAARIQLLDDSFRGRGHPYVLNMLKILVGNGHIRSFCDCRKAFESRYNDEHGILPVCAVTAVPLTKTQQDRLLRKLQSIMGKTVLLTNQIDPTCLGGVRLYYNGKLLDGTVKNHLKKMGDILKETVL